MDVQLRTDRQRTMLIMPRKASADGKLPYRSHWRVVPQTTFAGLRQRVTPHVSLGRVGSRWCTELG